MGSDSDVILQLFVRKIILTQQVDVLPGNHRAVCHSIEKHLPGRGILDLFQLLRQVEIIGRGRKQLTWSDVYFSRANEIDYEQHALVDTRLEIPDTGREYRHSRQHARHYCGRIQSERGISKSDASQRRSLTSARKSPLSKYN